MGRKGVSKRKSKKSRPFSKNDISGTSNTRSGERSQVQALVKDKSAPLNSSSQKPAAGSNQGRNKR